MSLTITDRCINCGYCKVECPNQAIYEPGMRWSMAEGTTLFGEVTLNDGRKVDAGEYLEPISDQYYFIVPEKCTNCAGLHEKPACQTVCPDPDSLITDDRYGESMDSLLLKQNWLNS